MCAKFLMACLLAASFLVGGAAHPAAAAGPTPQATVLASALNVRSGPGTDYGVIAVLRQGSQAGIVGRNAAAGWWQVELSDGTTGWISGSPALVQADEGAAQTPEVVAPPHSTPARAASSASKGNLLAIQTISGGPIWLVNRDGSGLRQLTTGMDPALSPDGRQVAFTRWQGTQIGAPGSLWSINVDGTGERQVLYDARQAKSPAWSPDGKQIMISVQAGGTVDWTKQCLSTPRGLFCLDMMPDPHRGLQLVNVADGSFQDQVRDIHSFSPTWDPANAWHVIFQGDTGLVSLDINRQVTWKQTEDKNDHSPAFSPDGRKIAVSYYQHDHWDIHVMNADGSGRARLTETPSTVLMNNSANWNNAAPVWSPDGTQLAFVTDRSGQWEVWVMNADGSNQRPMFASAVQKILGLQYNGVDERMISWR